MIRFYGEELFERIQNSELENHPLSVVRDCLFNIFAATLHIASRSSIHNLRTAMPWWQGPAYCGWEIFTIS